MLATAGEIIAAQADVHVRKRLPKFKRLVGGRARVYSTAALILSVSFLTGLTVLRDNIYNNKMGRVQGSL